MTKLRRWILSNTQTQTVSNGFQCSKLQLGHRHLIQVPRSGRVIDGFLFNPCPEYRQIREWHLEQFMKQLKVSSWTRRFGWSLYMLILFLNSECAGMGHRLQLSQQIYVQHEPHGHHENWTLLEVKQSLTSCRFTARLAYKFRTELKTCFWNW